jgi:hypothetical protein
VSEARKWMFSGMPGRLLKDKSPPTSTLRTGKAPASPGFHQT